MKLCFAASDEMIEKQGMPERFDKAYTYNWTLSHGQSKYGETFLAAVLATNEGDVVNAMKEFGIDKPYMVCVAECKDADVLEGLRAAMVGDVVWEAKVVITELTRVE